MRQTGRAIFGHSRSVLRRVCTQLPATSTRLCGSKVSSLIHLLWYPTEHASEQTLNVLKMARSPSGYPFHINAHIADVSNESGIWAMSQKGYKHTPPLQLQQASVEIVRCQFGTSAQCYCSSIANVILAEGQNRRKILMLKERGCVGSKIGSRADPCQSQGCVD
jgi:hypothetical protein